MTRQATLFDFGAAPVAPPAPAAAPRPVRDWEAFHRAYATLPKPVARGINTCAACLGRVGPVGSVPQVFLAVDCKVASFARQTLVDAEQILFHATCHARWDAERRAQAWAIVAQQQGESRRAG